MALVLLSIAMSLYNYFSPTQVNFESEQATAVADMHAKLNDNCSQKELIILTEELSKPGELSEGKSVR